LTEYDDDRPVVLLVGSSFTQQGIDPEVLAEILGESGRRITVLPLAIGGLSHLERLYYLKEYLAHAKRMPQLVLFEIAGGYDNGPLFQLQQMSFSDRMVAMMDGSSAWWAFRWLFSMDGLRFANAHRTRWQNPRPSEPARRPYWFSMEQHTRPPSQRL
jgi:hypothetical protein